MNMTKNQNEEIINNANLDLNRKNEKTKSVKTRRCYCGSTIGVKYKMCPYAKDVFNEIVYRWRCERCYQAAIDDI